jgi:hypothetical protein
MMARRDKILDTVWQSALVGAKGTEDGLGPNAIGPWDDFEWGMLGT